MRAPWGGLTTAAGDGVSAGGGYLVEGVFVEAAEVDAGELAEEEAGGGVLEGGVGIDLEDGDEDIIDGVNGSDVAGIGVFDFTDEGDEGKGAGEGFEECFEVGEIGAFGELGGGEAAEGEGFFDEFAVGVGKIEVGDVFDADDFEAGEIDVFGEVC